MSGNAWDSSIVITRGKLNQMTILSGISAYLNGLTKTKNQVWLPEDSGAGMNAYNLYAWDGSVLRNLSNPIHGHSGDNDGGQIAYQAYMNSKLVDTLELFLLTTHVADYLVTNDGAGSSSADDNTTGPDSIKHTAGAVLNGRSYMKLDGQKVDFTAQIFLAMLAKVNTLTNVSWNMGVNCEWVGDTNDTIRKILFEYCTSVNTHDFIAASDGTTRTSTDTGVVVDANAHFFKFLYYPAVKVVWAIDATTGIKTTNVPTNGAGTVASKCFTTGIKTTNSALSTANSFGPRLVFRAADTLY